MDVRQYACLTVGVDHLTIKRSGGSHGECTMKEIVGLFGT